MQLVLLKIKLKSNCNAVFFFLIRDITVFHNYLFFFFFFTIITFYSEAELEKTEMIYIMKFAESVIHTELIAYIIFPFSEFQPLCLNTCCSIMHATNSIKI